MAEFTTSSIFGDLTKVVNLRLDAATRKHKQIYDAVQYESYLDWDTPTIGLDFNEIMGKYNISIAAPTIGEESMEAVMDTDGVETWASSVYRHAITRPMTDQEYRKVLSLRDSRYISDATVREELIKLMWGNVETVIKAVQNKLDLIFLTALSNKGVFEFDKETNPLGGVRESVNYNMPDENKYKVNTPWTDANANNVDVFEDIQLILDAVQDKATVKEILLDPSVISYMLRTRKLKLALLGSDKSATPLFLANLNQFMSSNGLPQLKPMRRLITLKKGEKPIKPWNPDNMVFIPNTDNGKIGTIKNAFANSELRPKKNGIAYSNYGRIRVSQWGVGEEQNSNGVEFTKAESLSLPVITEMNGIFNLNIKGE